MLGTVNEVHSTYYRYRMLLLLLLLLLYWEKIHNTSNRQIRLHSLDPCHPCSIQKNKNEKNKFKNRPSIHHCKPIRF